MRALGDLRWRNAGGGCYAQPCEAAAQLQSPPAASRNVAGLCHLADCKTLEDLRAWMVRKGYKLIDEGYRDQGIVIHVASEFLDVCKDRVEVSEIFFCWLGQGPRCWHRNDVHPCVPSLEDQLRSIIGGPAVGVLRVRLSRNDVLVDVVVVEDQNRAILHRAGHLRSVLHEGAAFFEACHEQVLPLEQDADQRSHLAMHVGCLAKESQRAVLDEQDFVE